MPDFFILSLIILGVFICTSEGYIFHKIKLKLSEIMGARISYHNNDIDFLFKKKWQEMLWMPIIGCPTCMVSIWGIVYYTIHCQYSIASFYELPELILMSCAFNFIIYKNFMEKHL